MNYPFQAPLTICAILFCTKISYTNGIINGRDPKLNEVRYTVAVVGGGLCSGGIMGNKHVITNAHCIKIGKNNKLKTTKVIAATNVSSNYDPNVSIVKYVKRAFVPYAFFKSALPHDFAVLELSESLRIGKNSDKLQKLDLPTSIESNPPTYASYEDVVFKTAGFGSSQYKFVKGKNGKMRLVTFAGGRLHVANATVLKWDTCKKAYGYAMENGMCMAVIEDPQRRTIQGTCYGDSGAPMVVNDTVVIGVFNGGHCNHNAAPGIGIRITAFMSFIENAMNGTVTPDMKVYNAW